MVYHAEKVECLLNCPNCDKELLDEDVAFCPNCGESLETESRSSDYVLVAAVLTIVAAAFCAGLGYIAVYQYNYWVSYYASLGSTVPQEILGFLIFGIPGLIVSAFAIAGAIFMLKRKSIILSILGDILLLVSVFITYMIVGQYQYGYTDTMFLSEVSIVIFAILSAVFVLKSRNEFA